MLLFLILQHNGQGRCTILNFDTKTELIAFFAKFQVSCVSGFLLRQKYCQKQARFQAAVKFCTWRKWAALRKGITVVAEEVYYMFMQYWPGPANNLLCYPIRRSQNMVRNNRDRSFIDGVSFCLCPRLIWKGNISERNHNLEQTFSD